MNKAIIMGNLGSKPELRYTQGGEPVCNFSVATNKKWKSKSGEMKEATEWHRIVVWGKQAEHCEKYLDKGRSVLIEGEIQTTSWEDKDGNTRYTTEINARNVQFLGGGSGPAPEGARRRDSAPQDNFDQSFNDDDIPF